MVIGSFPRRTCDLLAPFQAGGQFEGLRVESCELLPLLDSAWADYERDGNGEAFAVKHARFFRSVFAPSLAGALTTMRNGAGAVFADHLESGLKRHLTEEPTPLHSFVQVMVVAK